MLVFLVLFFGCYVLFGWFFYYGKDRKELVAEANGTVYKQGKLDLTNGCVVEDCGDFWFSFEVDGKKVKSPIVEGVTADKLAKGIGHHKTTALPNKENSNVVLSGHRWKFGKNPFYTVFENIDALQNGDKVTVHYQDQDYIYEIYKSEVVPEDKTEILTQEVDEPRLTFYTCTPKYTAWKRLVYYAKLVN